MLLKKKVKAGILLYALLMLAVFSLLLQFYLHRQEAESRLVQGGKARNDCLHHGSDGLG
ncbi:competence protein ComGG [Streptococcus suis]|nr:competence protein ComGG [Streptococcus suis]CYU25245.1 competence protein ComGG [Streptococcus suis]CYV35139.1 competence protein ComGG [Streptococcus suis]